MLTVKIGGLAKNAKKKCSDLCRDATHFHEKREKLKAMTSPNAPSPEDLSKSSISDVLSLVSNACCPKNTAPVPIADQRHVNLAHLRREISDLRHAILANSVPSKLRPYEEDPVHKFLDIHWLLMGDEAVQGTRGSRSRFEDRKASLTKLYSILNELNERSSRLQPGA